jgi:preprotein translocase subunit SecA
MGPARAGKRRWPANCSSTCRLSSGRRNEPNLRDEEMLRRIVDAAAAAYAEKVELVGAEMFHQFERNVMLQSLDTHWREHLAALDHLRQGYICAATRRRTRSRSTSAKPSSCSSVCSTACAST